MYTHKTSQDKQKGAVLALFAVALVLLIGMAGLVLDVSHAYLDKTRLQNAVDAAALSGAFSLMNTQNEYTAEAAALATFKADLESEFINQNDGSSKLTPVVNFSDSLATWSGSPASSDDSTARFVQVRLLDNQAHQMLAWLTRIFNRNVLPVGVSATAGPIRSAPCKLDPFIVCGTPGPKDEMCAEPEKSCYGFDRWNTGDSNPPKECYLKGCSGNKNCNKDVVEPGGCGVQDGGAVGGINGDIGPGNFYTARLGCNGANCVRDAFKDVTENNCADLEGNVDTEPGNMVGPVKQGYNTKFGEYKGSVNPVEWPRDEVTAETLAGGARMFYDDYVNQTGIPGDNARRNKRVMNVIIADCTGKNSGATSLPVLTIGCFFGTQKIASDDGGNEIVVWGQFVSGKACGGDAITLDNTIDSYKIILYKDPDTGDS